MHITPSCFSPLLPPLNVIPKLLLPLLTVALCLTGCHPESTNPLSSPTASLFDDRLDGVYVQEDDGERTFWHFRHRVAPAKSSTAGEELAQLEVTAVNHAKNNGGLETRRFQALATRLGGRTYLSFIEISPGVPKPSPTFNFARYEVNWLGELRVWLASDDAFAQAVKAGQLKGKVTGSGSGSTVLLTDTTERLAAFVAAGDAKKLFGGKPVSLGRLPW